MERHPLLPQWELLDYAARTGLVLQVLGARPSLFHTYTPLCSTPTPPPIRSTPAGAHSARLGLAPPDGAPDAPAGRGGGRTLARPGSAAGARSRLTYDLGDVSHRTAGAFVFLQWNLRHGVAVAPKCSSAAHGAECLSAAPPAAAALSASQMRTLDRMSEICERRFVVPPFMTSATAVAAGYGWDLKGA